MPGAPKRLPGERNPTANADAPMHTARQGWMGGEDYGIARSVIGITTWRKRRKELKARQSPEVAG